MEKIRSKILLVFFLGFVVSSLFTGKSFAQLLIEKEPLEKWRSVQLRALSFKIPSSYVVPTISDASARESATGKIVKYAEQMLLYKSFGGHYESFSVWFLKDEKIDKLKKENILGINRFYNKTIVVDGQPALYTEEHTSKIDQYGKSDNGDWIEKQVKIQFGKDVYWFTSSELYSPSDSKNSIFDKILSTFKFTQSIAKSPNIYTVKKGDTLWNIAEKVYKDNFKWAEIAKANELVNPDLIHPGNVFVIPTLD